jgi:hypothetical protein
VQSPPFPRWARGWVGDPRARSRTPPTPIPFAKKSRSQDVKPTFLLCSTSKPSQTVGEPGAACGVSELPGHGWALQLEVADWVSFGRLLQLWRPSQGPSSRGSSHGVRQRAQGAGAGSTRGRAGVGASGFAGAAAAGAPAPFACSSQSHPTNAHPRPLQWHPLARRRQRRPSARPRGGDTGPVSNAAYRFQ